MARVKGSAAPSLRPDLRSALLATLEAQRKRLHAAWRDSLSARSVDPEPMIQAYEHATGIDRVEEIRAGHPVSVHGSELSEFLLRSTGIVRRATYTLTSDSRLI